MKPDSEVGGMLFTDMGLGMVIFGVTGALIGYYLCHWAVVIAGTVAGSVLGGFVGKLGARRFFLSVLVGTVVGGLLGWLAGGGEGVRLGAGRGRANCGVVGGH